MVTTNNKNRRLSRVWQGLALGLMLTGLLAGPALAQSISTGLDTETEEALQNAQPNDLSDPGPQPETRRGNTEGQGADRRARADTDLDTLGQNLFNGDFSRQEFAGFNPDYRISVGDVIQIQLWGAVEFQGELAVDAQGNIFLPQVGPVGVEGVVNSDLNQVVSEAVTGVYRQNVRVYANLNAAKPINVFVTGNVLRPGLYSGRASDSPLTFLDRAGGVDPDRGSYLDVALRRDGRTLEQVNLYDFLLRGEITRRQLREGDTLVVGPRQYVVSFSGLVENPYRIEFPRARVSLQAAARLARPKPAATHVRIERRSRASHSVEYLPLDEARTVTLHAGDRVEYVNDKPVSTITVFVEGEQLGRQQYVLPYGAALGDLLDQVTLSPRSNTQAIQLFRESVARRQKAMLDSSLENLQMSVLTAPSGTVEEAQLRTQEADLVLQFIDRAREIEPRGQVVLANAPNLRDITLQEGDRLRIPEDSSLVSMSGEVMLPTAVLHHQGYELTDYLDQAGGLSRKADRSRVVIRNPDGSIVLADLGRWFRSATDVSIQPGDEIMVLPEVDFKTLQFTKDIVQILYQSAVAAGVVLAL